LRNIEKQIDEFYLTNDLVQIPYSQALWYLLGYYEDKYLVTLSGFQKLSINQISAFIDNIIIELKHSIHWIYSSCPKDGTYTREFNEYYYKASHRLAELAQNYLNFETLFTYGSQGLIQLEVVDSTIMAVGNTFEDSTHEAYDRLLEETPQKNIKNKDKIIKSIIKSLSVKGGDFSYVASKKLICLAIKSMNIYDDNIFTLPSNWNLGSYSIDEFRRMYKVILALSFIHLLARGLAAELGCAALGFYNGLIVISKTDLIRKISIFSSVKEKTACQFVEELTYGEQGIKNPDPALQPLFKIENDTYILMPSLLLGSSAERNYIVLMNRIPEKRQNYLKLVQEKEICLKGKIQSEITLPSIHYYSGKPNWTNSLPDIDLAIISDKDKTVTCLELKWFICPSEPREVIEKSKEIQKGISQLLKLRDEFLYYPSYFQNLMKVDDSYEFFFILLSENNIGLGVFQDKRIPVLKVSHFIEQVNTLKDLREVSNWCIGHKYLPVQNQDFLKCESHSKIGEWKANWYGIRSNEGDLLSQFI
jgi:hypothetical protein